MRHQIPQSLRPALWVGLTAGLMFFSVVVFSAGVHYSRSSAASLLATVTISGHLRNVNQRGLKDEQLSLLNFDDLSTIATTKTDSNGLYSFPNLASGGNYTVRPDDSRVSSWFLPKVLPTPQFGTQRDYQNLTQNISDADFEAHFPSFSVKGFVKNTAGTALQGEKIRLSGQGLTPQDLLPTLSDGSYTSPQLNILGDYTFTPQSVTVGGVTYNSFNPDHLDFLAIETCSGAQCSGFDYLGKNYTAITPIQVTVQTNPVGRSFTVDNTTYTTTQVFSWTPSSNHTISTTSPQSGATGTQYVYSGWNDGQGMSHTVSPSSATTYTANFTTQYQLTMNAGSGGQVSPASGFFNTGQVVPISATPNSGFSFSGWTGSGSGSFTGSTSSASVTMNGPITESASFASVGPPPGIQFSSPSYAVNEGSGSVTVTVTRSGPTTGAASVSYTTGDTASANCGLPNTGKASSHCDYETTIGTLNFAPGETSKDIKVPVIDDSYAEGDEAFTVTLSNVTGTTLNSPSVATVMINDNETVTGANPIDQSSFFVNIHYFDFFNRTPDPSGYAFWQSNIENCGSDMSCREVKRIDTSAAFYLSIEFQQTGYLVERMYKVAYGDKSGTSTLGGNTHTLSVPIIRLSEFLPDTQQIGAGVVVGQAGWEQLLESNKQAFAAAFVQRQRFANAFAVTLTPDQFVDQLFTNSGVSPTASERAGIVSEFGGAVNTADLAARGRALRRVAEHPTLTANEFNRAFVLMQYFGYLRRDPDGSPDSDYTGYDNWLTKLIQFNGSYQNAEMVKAFISSTEYRNRSGP